MKLRLSDAKKKWLGHQFFTNCLLLRFDCKNESRGGASRQKHKTPTPFFVFCGQSYSRQGYLNLIQAFVLTFNTGNDVVVVNILIRWKKTIATIDVMNNEKP